MEQGTTKTTAPPRAVLIELAYNTLGNYMLKLQQENSLSHDEMGTVLLKMMQDNQAARLIEASGDILKLTQQLNDLEAKEEEREDDNTVDQA